MWRNHKLHLKALTFSLMLSLVGSAGLVAQTNAPQLQTVTPGNCPDQQVAIRSGDMGNPMEPTGTVVTAAPQKGLPVARNQTIPSPLVLSPLPS